MSRIIGSFGAVPSREPELCWRNGSGTRPRADFRGQQKLCYPSFTVLCAQVVRRVGSLRSLPGPTNTRDVSTQLCTACAADARFSLCLSIRLPLNRRPSRYFFSSPLTSCFTCLQLTGSVLTPSSGPRYAHGSSVFSTFRASHFTDLKT